MTPELQLAESRKYDSTIICTIAEISPGIFALYQFAKVLYIGDWSGVLDAYRARPPYIRKPRTPRVESRSSRGKISAAEKAANTARLLALLKEPKHEPKE